MPLKHDTETVMVVALAILIGLAGAVAAFLPPLTVSVLPWAVAFILAIAYPLALYPILKERRADYEFRALHFVPALILLVWMALDLLATFRPQWELAQSMYTWSWAGAVVAAAFVLLVIFCLRVIRQWIPRLSLLVATFLLFVLLSQLSEYFHWDRQLAVQWWGAGTGAIVANTSPSDDQQEEQWRAEIRQMQRRSQQLANNTSSGISATAVSAISGMQSAASIARSSAPSSIIVAQNNSKHSGSTSSRPPHLPSAGFGPEGFALVLIAGCCAMIQRKTVMRSRI